MFSVIFFKIKVYYFGFRHPCEKRPNFLDLGLLSKIVGYDGVVVTPLSKNHCIFPRTRVNLSFHQQKVLSRGSINQYVMGVSGPLGPLIFLRVWHDNTGKSKKASWFLDKVVITDVQTSDM